MKGFGFFKRRREQRHELGKRYVQAERERETRMHLQALQDAAKRQKKGRGRFFKVNCSEGRVGLPGSRPQEKRDRKAKLRASRACGYSLKHGRQTKVPVK